MKFKHIPMIAILVCLPFCCRNIDTRAMFKDVKHPQQRISTPLIAPTIYKETANFIDSTELTKLVAYTKTLCDSANVNFNLVFFTIFRESRFNAKAKNKNSTARGLGQFTKACAKHHKAKYVKLKNPYYAIRFVVERYKQISKMTNSEAVQLLCYGSFKNIEIDSVEALDNEKYKEYLQFSTKNEMYNKLFKGVF